MDGVLSADDFVNEELRSLGKDKVATLEDLMDVKVCMPKGTGEYDKFFADGVYTCAGCGTPLSKSTTKFNSGCGWPTFYEGLPRAITRTADPDGRRTRITCTACGGHLGNVFKGEGFKTPTDERHCVKGIVLIVSPSSLLLKAFQLLFDMF